MYSIRWRCHGGGCGRATNTHTPSLSHLTVTMTIALSCSLVIDQQSKWLEHAGMPTLETKFWLDFRSKDPRSIQEKCFWVRLGGELYANGRLRQFLESDFSGRIDLFIRTLAGSPCFMTLEELGLEFILSGFTDTGIKLIAASKKLAGNEKYWSYRVECNESLALAIQEQLDKLEPPTYVSVAALVGSTTWADPTLVSKFWADLRTPDPRSLTGQRFWMRLGRERNPNFVVSDFEDATGLERFLYLALAPMTIEELGRELISSGFNMSGQGLIKVSRALAKNPAYALFLVPPPRV